MLKYVLKILPVIIVMLGWSCGSKKREQSQNAQKTFENSECIESVLTIDDSIGRIRNHACETVSLSLAIEKYTREIRALNYENCPEGFIHAFRNHLTAWDDMIEITDDYPEWRGEMHVLFDSLNSSADSVPFNQKLEDIWNTWEEVEKFSNKGK